MSTQNMLRFDGRVALVTGGGRGIGREYALTLARRGATVLVNDLGGGPDGVGASDTPALEVVDEIRRLGGKAEASFASVASEAGCRAVVESALSRFGRLDVIINNAGGGGGPWTDMIDLNLSSTFWILDAAWPQLLAQQYGRVLTTSSAAGLFGTRPLVQGVGLKWFAYSAAKMGIVGLTRCFAHEGRRTNIKVNGISPVAYSRMSNSVSNADAVAWVKQHFPAHHIATAAACLVHESVPCSGEVFSVGGGRVSKVVIAETDGYIDRELTPESLMANLGQAADESRLHQPRSVDGEMKIYTQLLGIPESAYTAAIKRPTREGVSP
jgi:NAD(P)-dependent dehydrogenase (short-subunit alcohol dehydrogenase family)